MRRLHAYAGFLVSFWLLVLTLTGLLLNHEKNLFSLDFLWRVELPRSLFSDQALKRNGKADITSAVKTPAGYFIGAFSGLYAPSGRRVYEGRVFKVELLRSRPRPELLLATDDGLKLYKAGKVETLALKGRKVTAVSLSYPKVLLVVDRRDLYLYDFNEKRTLFIPTPLKAEPTKEVTLKRFVRDFHYGRGLLPGESSALLNDAFSVALLVSTVSGFLYFLVRKSRRRRLKRFLFRVHASRLLIVTLPFVLLLALTGLFINRPRLYEPLLKEKLPELLTPPVYRAPFYDVWDADLSSGTVRIATRLGLYELKRGRWELVYEGFTYRLRRFGERLYLAGMGVPNRLLYKGRCYELPGVVKMPVDFVVKNGQVVPVSRSELPLEREKLPLYEFLLSLHDATLITPVLNDLTGVLTVFLTLSASYFWLKRIKVRFTAKMPQPGRSED
ncbi:MAG: PepSY domain-containing protein [Aquificae bacterium]|nr:PepSY domain-containing protein [Aquificota bacterium]